MSHPTVITTDVVIVGAGAAGLYCALNLPGGVEVTVVEKGATRPGSTPFAQGGMAAPLGPDDSPELHAEDTRRVGVHHCDDAAVAILCSEAAASVHHLASLGCPFDRNEDGSFHLAREGGQSVARSVHARDATGAAISATLREHSAARTRTVKGQCLSLAIVDGECVGCWVMSEEGPIGIGAGATVLATGGVGAMFSATTNPAGATGDGIAIAWEAGAGITDLEFVQMHPTALAGTDDAPRALLTEALRGAGAFVVDASGRRFLFEHHPDGELAPRDIVSTAVASQPSWLDCRHLDAAFLEDEFRQVADACRARGFDLTTDLLPIQPAAHYSIGGIETDLDGRTSLPHLYAIGECAGTGVHGANRLPGNSLTEALVFGRRAAAAIEDESRGLLPPLPPPRDLGDGPREGTPEEAWRDLRRLSSLGLGIKRDERSVSEMLEGLEAIPVERCRGDMISNEVRFATRNLTLMGRSALLRRESRGVHRRNDHPQRDPTWDGVRLRVQRDRPAADAGSSTPLERT